MGKRMSPNDQAIDRDRVAAAMSTAKTGDAEMDSLIGNKIRINQGFSGLQPSVPKFGNPITQLVGGIKSGIHWLQTYDPYKKAK